MTSSDGFSPETLSSSLYNELACVDVPEQTLPKIGQGKTDVPNAPTIVAGDEVSLDEEPAHTFPEGVLLPLEDQPPTVSSENSHPVTLALKTLKQLPQ